MFLCFDKTFHHRKNSVNFSRLGKILVTYSVFFLSRYFNLRQRSYYRGKEYKDVCSWRNGFNNITVEEIVSYSL